MAFLGCAHNFVWFFFVTVNFIYLLLMSTCQEGHTHNFPEELLRRACSFVPTKRFLIDIKIRIGMVCIIFLFL